MRWWSTAVLLALALVAQPGLAHVRFVFPAARQPALDYFSNRNAQAPCGVAKPPAGSGIRTFLKAGTTVDLEWFAAIPHTGGIRIEVLNAIDEPIALFTNFPDEYNVSQPIKRIELPEHFECPNCAFRLTSQATEYGDDFYFFTCADVNILKEIPDGDSCLGHGVRQQGKCTCEVGYIGDQCQYKTDCEQNDDCGEYGECRLTKDDPRGQCYCEQGHFGGKCQNEAEVLTTSAQFDGSKYHLREAEDNKIYWRILNDEIEVVLRYPGQSWAAIGWKPRDAVCSTHPGVLSLQAATAVKKAEIKPELSKPAKPTQFHRIATPTTTPADKECSPNEIWSDCPEISRACEASCDWTRFPETVPNCPKSKCGPARCVCQDGYVRMNNGEEACVPFDFCEKDTPKESSSSAAPTQQPQSCPENSIWAKCGTACEPSCADMNSLEPCAVTCSTPACTCMDNHVRHEGKCIYWGNCPANFLNQIFHSPESIGDEVTSSMIENNAKTVPTTRAPTTTAGTTKAPVALTCAVNETVNECGRTCEIACADVLSRTECDDCGGAPECACIQGYARNAHGTCVYWGDCTAEDKAVTRSMSIATSDVSVTKAPRFPTVEGDVCYGDFRYPAGCVGDCEYKLSWNYIEDKDEIEFSLETRVAQNWWSGVGFSKDGTMNDADMLIVKSRDGKLTVQDMGTDGYAAPTPDAQDDIAMHVVGTHVNGVLRVQFNRKLNTGDPNDKQFDKECWRMLYPIRGGRIDENGGIAYHSATPLVSNKEVCIRSCHQKKTATSDETCETEFRYPENCQGNDCKYIARWNYDSTKKDVRFEITSENPGRWTGIGFSKDGQMTNADIYTGWMYEGKAYVTDRFAYGRQLPAIDPADRQDIYDVGGRLENDKQTIWFRRKVVSEDKLTDLSLDKCYHFLFPIGGGRVLVKKSSDYSNPRIPIGYHDQYQPAVSPKKICLCDERGVSLGHVETEPIRVRSRRQAIQQVAASAAIPPNKQHPMDCTDMVVGFVNNGMGRVADMYSPSKATPRPDSFFGGRDSLTAASAFYEDGITTVTFRKKLIADDEWDRTIAPGPMTVIWAKGADPANYQHTTGGDPIRADPGFFIDGNFKYHGKNHRGTLNIDFFDASKRPEPTMHGLHMESDTCSGSIGYPANCRATDCAFRVSWLSDGTVARFQVQARMEEDQWTALGFSPDGGMADSDVIIIGKRKQESIAVTDQYMPNYGRPIVDKQQDIFDVESSLVDGVLTANFSRELYSDDSKDVNLQQCVYLLYPPAPGVIEENGEIRKHGETPIASHTRICLNTCSEIPTKISTGVPSTPSVRPTTTVTSEEEPVVRVETTPAVEATPELVNRPVEVVTSATTTQKPIVVEPTTATPKETPVKQTPFVVYEPEDPVKARYSLWVRILNKPWQQDLADSSSEYYQTFTKDVTDSVNGLLDKRWKGMRVAKVLGYSKSPVTAELEVVSTNAVARPVELKSLVEENAVRGHIGSLAIEPSTVRVREIAEEQVAGDESLVHSAMARNILIIALAAIVLIIAATCAICLLCKIRRKSRFDSYPVQHGPGYYGTMQGKPPMSPEANGFENAGYHGVAAHQRHYSQATTASTKAGGGNSPHTSSNEPTPGGIGEASYAEWYSKHGQPHGTPDAGHRQYGRRYRDENDYERDECYADYDDGSKPASQRHEESALSPPAALTAQPYVSYPNDPSAYYTLGGEHRTNPHGPPPPMPPMMPPQQQPQKYFRY